MKELVFLLEEPSAKALLEVLLPRFLDPTIMPRFIPFEGKQDLDKQLERKLRSYLNPKARFLVLRDQDSADCSKIKAQLLTKCAAAGRAATALVRVACRELETFYLADLAAVEAAYGLSGLVAQQEKKKFRAPDYLGSPSQELRTLTRQQYQKVSGSRQLERISRQCIRFYRTDDYASLFTGFTRTGGRCGRPAGPHPRTGSRSIRCQRELRSQTPAAPTLEWHCRC